MPSYGRVSSSWGSPESRVPPESLAQLADPRYRQRGRPAPRPDRGRRRGSRRRPPPSSRSCSPRRRVARVRGPPRPGSRSGRAGWRPRSDDRPGTGVELGIQPFHQDIEGGPDHGMVVPGRAHEAAGLVVPVQRRAKVVFHAPIIRHGGAS